VTYREIEKKPRRRRRYHESGSEAARRKHLPPDPDDMPGTCLCRPVVIAFIRYMRLYFRNATDHCLRFLISVFLLERRCEVALSKKRAPYVRCRGGLTGGQDLPRPVIPSRDGATRRDCDSSHVDIGDIDRIVVFYEGSGNMHALDLWNQQILDTNRQITHPNSSRVIHRIGDRRGYSGKTDLADPSGPERVQLIVRIV